MKREYLVRKKQFVNIFSTLGKYEHPKFRDINSISWKYSLIFAVLFQPESESASTAFCAGRLTLHSGSCFTLYPCISEQFFIFRNLKITDSRLFACI